MRRPAVFVSMALLLTALGAAGHAQERRVICVVVDDLGFGASDQENGAKLLAILRDEVVRESDLVGFAATGSPVAAATMAAYAMGCSAKPPSIQLFGGGVPVL